MNTFGYLILALLLGPIFVLVMALSLAGSRKKR